MAEQRALDSTSGTLVERVMQVINQRISTRALGSGAKLPSIRSLAKTMQVSKSTVVEAYDRLTADGIIQSRHGSGFFVAGHSAPLLLAEIGPQLDRTIDPLWVSRQSLETGPDVLKPGCGWLPAQWMPDASIRSAMRSLARDRQRTLIDYGSPLGHLPLRQLIARRMIDLGIDVAPGQILLTESGTQAIELLCRFLLEPGDTVLVDDPCYFNFHALLRAHRANIVSVPYTPCGPQLDLFSQALSDHRPKLYITNSAIHNPTGATLSPLVAHRLLKLSASAGLTIIEDDVFADFEHEPAPRLAAFDGFDRVVHIGSFSKTISAAFRCGYIAARPDWIEGLIDLKIATSFGGGSLASELVYGILKDSTYRKHLGGLRDRLAAAMKQTCGRLKSNGIMPWLEPRAGMFLWCELPDGLDAGDIARKALAKNIILAPGNAFSVAQSASRFLRFNVAQSSDPRIMALLKTAMQKK